MQMKPAVIKNMVELVKRPVRVLLGWSASECVAFIASISTMTPPTDKTPPITRCAVRSFIFRSNQDSLQSSVRYSRDARSAAGASALFFCDHLAQVFLVMGEWTF